MLVGSESAAIRFCGADLLVLDFDESVVGAVGAEHEFSLLANPDLNEIFVLPRLVAGQPIERLPAHGDHVAAAAGGNAFQRFIGLRGPGEHNVRIGDHHSGVLPGAEGDQLLADPASIHPVVIGKVDEPPMVIEFHVAEDLDHVAGVEGGAQQISAAGTEATGSHLHDDCAPDEIGSRAWGETRRRGDAGSRCIGRCVCCGWSACDGGRRRFGRSVGSGERRRCRGFRRGASGQQDRSGRNDN